jgi:hypothetical protein
VSTCSNVIPLSQRPVSSTWSFLRKSIGFSGCLSSRVISVVAHRSYHWRSQRVLSAQRSCPVLTSLWPLLNARRSPCHNIVLRSATYARTQTHVTRGTSPAVQCARALRLIGPRRRSTCKPFQLQSWRMISPASPVPELERSRHCVIPGRGGPARIPRL